jgi:non-specific serine/threonine protein kinase/serine/threonine-protein kinase
VADEHFVRLKRILLGAIELPLDRRRAWVRTECAGDGELLAEAEAKLARLDEDPSILVTGGLEAFVRTRGEPSNAAPDLVPSAASYRILDRIGEGGFGEVHRAEQLEPVRRLVALKVLKAGLDTRAILARFEAERQALAVMDHPGIAKVFDAGRTAEGRPYFAMEYVAGLPITQYCDRERLGAAERLCLFVRVCEAVQHAHQKAVIHRDLKPSNVLVGAKNDGVDVKVIDFGVAKALAQPLTGRTLHTEIGQLIGTPEYMSPEQADMSSDIDTRSDVYSLGAMLYELLTGQRPFEGARLREVGIGGVSRILRETDPPKPSARVSTSSPEVVTPIAAARRTTPNALAGLLRGDLDWITMRALERDRARRYGSAAELAADLERHLRREPVLARPPSALYLAERLASRHRGPVAVAAAAVLLIAGFGIWMSILYTRADRLRAAAGESQAHAQARAEELELVTRFQSSMLTDVDPDRMGRSLRTDLVERARAALEEGGMPAPRAEAALATFDDLLLRAGPTDVALGLLDEEVLARAAAAMDTEFDGEPLVQAALRQTLAFVYRELGLLERAAPLQDAALEVRRDMLGADHRETLSSMESTALLRLAEGRLEEGLVLAEAAEAGCRRALGDQEELTVSAMIAAAECLWGLGRYDESLARYTVARERASAAAGPDGAQALVALGGVGKSLWGLGRHGEALEALREALERKRRVADPDDREALVLVSNIGEVLSSAGRHEESLAYAREALEGNRRLLGTEHPFTLTALNNLGSRLALLGRLDEAESCFREALAGRRQVLGSAHAETIGAMSNLAFVLRGSGRPSEALPLHREALAGFRRALGDDHPSTLSAIKNTGKVLADLGRWEESVALLAPAEDAYRSAFAGDNARFTGDYYTALGRARARIAAWAAAEEDLRDAERIFAEAPGVTGQDRERLAAAFVELYEGWHAAEPAAGHGREVERWKATLAEAGRAPSGE